MKILAIILVLFWLGLVSIFLYPKVEIRVVEEVIKEIPMSERAKYCNSQGGEYFFMSKSWSKVPYESCEIEKNLF